MNSIHLSRIGNIFFDFYGSQAQKSLKSNSTKTHPKAPFHSYYIHFSLKVSEVGIYIRCSIQPIPVYSGFVLNLHPIVYSLLKWCTQEPSKNLEKDISNTVWHKILLNIIYQDLSLLSRGGYILKWPESTLLSITFYLFSLNTNIE